MRILFSSFSIVALVLCASSGAWAHSYITNEGYHTTANSAIAIGDIDLSQVVYHTVTPDTTTLWLRFEATAGKVAKIQLGVPLIEGLEDYRPAFALLGPGMPAIEELPFDVPEGYGGMAYTTDDVVEPTTFDEEFTGTWSWTFDMQEISLPADGTYYIVGYVPAGNLGKFWIAPGTVEKFGVKDIFSLPSVIYNVRIFHQVFPFGGILSWALALVLLIIGAFMVIVLPF